MPFRLPSARFVGREHDLARIARVLDAVAAGRPTTLLVAASPGIGATRLLVEARQRIAGLPRAISVLYGQAIPAWAGRAFAPVSLALGRYLAALDDEAFARIVEPAAHAVGVMLPGLRARLDRLELSPTRPLLLAPERRQERLFEEIRALIGRMTEVGPVVLMLDDLHLADAASRSLATFLTRTAHDRPLCLIASYQPDELTRTHPFEATLSALTNGPSAASRIDLAPLGRDQLAELIQAIDGERPTASTLLLVAERSGGNPLIAEELLTARRELSGASLTGSLDEIVRARIARRSHECRRVLRLLAVADGPLRLTDLAAVSAAFEATAVRKPPRSSRQIRPVEGPLPADLAAGLEEALRDGFVVTAPHLTLTIEPPTRAIESSASEGPTRAFERPMQAIAPPTRALEPPGPTTQLPGRRSEPPGTTSQPPRPPIQPAAPSVPIGSTVKPETSVSRDVPVAFRHSLIGRAILTDILPLQRRRLHSAVARGLADQPDRAVAHHLAAFQTSGARAAAVAAAALAEACETGAVALDHLELAIALQPTPAATAARGEASGVEVRPTAAGPSSTAAGTAPTAVEPSPTASGAASTAASSSTPAGAVSTGRRAAAPAAAPSNGGDPALARLLARAGEAAFAAQQSSRAAAFTESALAQLDDRRDRPAAGLLYERLGRYRWAAGDHEGAVGALRRAVELVGPDRGRERTLVVASLAQVLMLDGMFSAADRLAREAIEVARATGSSARGELGHALCTLGVVLAWGDQPQDGLRMLARAKEIAAKLGRLDDLFRVYANQTTVFDLLGRREDALRVAYEGIEEAGRVGLEAGYGNFLRGNAAESLTFMGRWDESHALSTAALEWSPSGIAFTVALYSLAALEVERSAGERAARLLGQLLLELETVADPQYSVPAYQAAASFALWRNDIADAQRSAERGWRQIRDTEDWTLIARMAPTALEVDAALAAEAREHRDLAGVASAREHSSRVLARAEQAVREANVPITVGSRREADAYLATARAFRARLEGRDDPATWYALAEAWQRLGNPYQAARARWREAEAVLAQGEGRAGRPRARRPLLAALETARSLGARPLLRELTELARRAMIILPSEVSAEPVAVMEPPAPRAPAAGIGLAWAPRGQPAMVTSGGPGAMALGRRASLVLERERGADSELVREFVGPDQPPPKPPDTFGLSPREREVLALIAQGRTNREIGERLFISQKTVGVHVGNILAKLGVSGRVEAATVAVRLSLTGARPGTPR